MRKIILNLAISLDGYISDNNGGFDWIVGHGDNNNDSKETFDFSEFMGSIDTVVMGSKAYEDCVLSGLETYADKKIIVATSRDLEGRKNVEFVNGDICGRILDLKKKHDGNIWLFGGAGLADAFIKADIVDEYIIGIIPTILGNGRLLFKGEYSKIDLHLDKVTVNDGITILIYSKR
ncbi:MAG: dihydrofolate reductase family protein [Clostridium sp.]